MVRFFSLSLPFFQFILQPVTVSVDIEDIRMVDNSVDNGSGGYRFLEDLSPFVKIIPLGADPESQFGSVAHSGGPEIRYAPK